MLGLGACSRTSLSFSSHSPPIVLLPRRSYASFTRCHRLQWRQCSPCPEFSVGRRLLTTTSTSRENNKATETTKESSAPQTKRSLLARFLPSSFAKDTTQSASSFRKIVALAKPEKKPLGIAFGLLLVSSTVSMSIPLTVGKLIDYFTSSNPVSRFLLPATLLV